MLLFGPSVAVARPGYALLATGQVIAVESSSGKVVARRTIGPRPRTALPTPLLVRRGDELHVVTPRLGGQTLVRLAASDLRELGRTPLPADVRFTALALSAAGVPHVAGTRDGAPVVWTPEREYTVKPANGQTWMPLGIAVSGGSLVLAYHGPDTTGADVLDLATGTIAACPDTNVRLGCLAYVHGTVAFAGGLIVGTSGSTELAVYDGLAREMVDTELPRNHLMALGRDATTGQVVAAATCSAANAFAVIDLARRTARARRGACGDAVAADRGLALIGASALRGRHGLAFVNIASARRLRFVRTAPAMAVAL